MKRNKKKVKEQRLIIKMFLCLIYLVAITILFVLSYNLHESNKNATQWSQVKSVDDYSYIEVSKMSEKFAYNESSNIGMHFVIEKEPTGVWHTYIIAIDEKNYDKYKNIIDYTYERTDKIPEPIKVYGYPVIVDNDLKNMAIKNIVNFVPSYNEITINEENYDTYLTNSYLDSTKIKKSNIGIVFYIILSLLFTIILLFLLTIFDKDKIVDNIDEEIDKTKRLLKIKEE